MGQRADLDENEVARKRFFESQHISTIEKKQKKQAKVDSNPSRKDDYKAF